MQSLKTRVIKILKVCLNNVNANINNAFTNYGGTMQLGVSSTTLRGEYSVQVFGQFNIATNPTTIYLVGNALFSTGAYQVDNANTFLYAWRIW